MTLSWCWNVSAKDGWTDRPRICVWCEDDVLRNDPGAEHLNDAVVRIVGSMYDCARDFETAPDGDDRGVLRPHAHETAKRLLGPRIDEVDYGDTFLSLYRNGWVVQSSFDGQSLWRIVEVS